MLSLVLLLLFCCCCCCYFCFVVVVTTRSGVLIFYRFFKAETKFVHDLNFDFFLFDLSPPFLIVDFCSRTLDFNNRLDFNIF